MKKSLWADFRKYLFEVLAIITGITLSFWFDEWRDRRQDRHDSIALLSSIADNLRTDTAILRLALDLQEKMTASEAHILHSDSLEADSLTLGMLGFQTYPTFRTTNVAYLTMVQTGQSRVLSNQKLLTQVNDLYQVQYKIIDEWTDIERKTVLERNIPYMNANAPFVLRYNYASLLGKDAQFVAMMKRNEFRNLLSTDYNFKSVISVLYGNVQKAADSLLRNVNEEIKALK